MLFRSLVLWERCFLAIYYRYVSKDIGLNFVSFMISWLPCHALYVRQCRYCVGFLLSMCICIDTVGRTIGGSILFAITSMQVCFISYVLYYGIDSTGRLDSLEIIPTWAWFFVEKQRYVACFGWRGLLVYGWTLSRSRFVRFPSLSSYMSYYKWVPNHNPSSAPQSYRGAV